LPAGLLRELQELLGHLYDADPGHDVRDFVVTDPALLEVLTGGVPGRDVDEKLIVMESGEGLDLALYLDAALLARLDRADPRSSLSPDNLGDFWTALEGVSHFNYLAWNAIHDRAVTLLELEMQAEVDKFVATRALLDRQPGADLGGPLWQQLFEATALMPGCEPAGGALLPEPPAPLPRTGPGAGRPAGAAGFLPGAPAPEDGTHPPPGTRLRFHGPAGIE
jgi:hypothetical protein